MQTFKVVLLTIISIVLLAAAIFFLIGYTKPKPSGVAINSTPTSDVYINGILVGKTPFQGTHEAGMITLKLVPEDQALLPFETKLTLTPGIETVVRREFGKIEDESSGDVISFEKEAGRNTSLIVISTPDNAQVSLDGVPRGFTPYKTSTISPAKHEVAIKTPGYIDRTMIVETRQGFRLTVFAKLAKSTEAQNIEQSAEGSASANIKTYVEILNTPTGFLRVRTEPGTAGQEIAEVKPGEKYPYLDTDTATGWFKIQYSEAKPGLPDGISGWISNQFAKKIDL